MEAIQIFNESNRQDFDLRKTREEILENQLSTNGRAGDVEHLDKRMDEGASRVERVGSGSSPDSRRRVLR
jgi:hypothetical protein